MRKNKVVQINRKEFIGINLVPVGTLKQIRNGEINAALEEYKKSKDKNKKLKVPELRFGFIPLVEKGKTRLARVVNTEELADKEILKIIKKYEEKYPQYKNLLTIKKSDVFKRTSSSYSTGVNNFEKGRQVA